MTIHTATYICFGRYSQAVPVKIAITLRGYNSNSETFCLLVSGAELQSFFRLEIR